MREEGLLHNNQIAVRVKSPKSETERARYTLENCAVEAKIIREQPANAGGGKGRQRPNKKDNANETRREDETTIIETPAAPLDKKEGHSRNNSVQDPLSHGMIDALRLDDDGETSNSDDDDSSDGEMPARRANIFSVLS